jgi:hypothetical protein
VFTTQDFLSIVADREDPEAGRLLVRARNRKHLKALLLECEPFQKRPSDYPWHVWAERDHVQQLLADQVQALSWDNFKNATPEADCHDACVEVWQAMWQYQQGKRVWEGGK